MLSVPLSHASTPSRPPLPRQLYAISVPAAAGFVAYALTLFAAAGTGAWAVATSAAPLWVRVPVTAVLVLAAGHGMHLMGFVGHEGIHLLLHPDKWVSMVVGSLVSAATGFSAVGYGVAHLNHHRFTNQTSDPDAQIYPRFTTFWARVLRARSAGTRLHVDNTVRLARGEALPRGYRLPFTRADERRLARLNLVFTAAWIGAYAGVAMWCASLALFGIVLPWLVGVAMSGLRGYLEHAGCDVGPFRDSRSYVSPLYTALFFGNNFHLEHHLYPGVPCYRLPTVHRLLRDAGHLARWEAPVERGVLRPLVHATAASQYPGPLAADLAYDPFASQERASRDASVAAH